MLGGCCNFKQTLKWMAPATPVFAAKAAPTKMACGLDLRCSCGPGMPAKNPTRWMAPALPVFAGAPAPTSLGMAPEPMNGQLYDCPMAHLETFPTRF